MKFPSNRKCGNKLTGESKQDERPDRVLIDLTLGGDKKAANGLILRYQQSLYAYVYRRVENHADTLDLCQEILLKAVTTKLETLKNRERFKGWLFAIARNEVNSFFREKKSPSHTVSIDEESLSQQIEDSSPTPDRKVEEDESRQILRQAVDQLPAKQGEVIRLMKEGLNNGEIADLLGIEEGTVRSHRRHCINSLKSSMKNYYQ